MVSDTVAYTYNPGSREWEKGEKETEEDKVKGEEGEEWGRGRGKEGGGGGRGRKEEKKRKEEEKKQRQQQKLEVFSTYTVPTAFSPTENRLAWTSTKEDHRLTGETRDPRY